jgi:hypothetical protein
MKAAGAALVAAAVFFAGVLFGSGGGPVGAPTPRPVVVAATGSGDPGGRRTEPRNAPAPEVLDVETVERPVQEGSVEDYGDHGNEGEGGDGSSGPGSGEPTPTDDPDPTESPPDNSGPGSANSGSGSDNSGSGSSSSGSGSGGSGSG